MSDPQDMEALADLEHKQWMHWMKYMVPEMLQEAALMHGPEFSQNIQDLKCMQRWQRQMMTPYQSLTEREKESDRNEVRKKLPLYRGANEG